MEFLGFTGIIGISLYQLRRYISAMLLDQLSDGDQVNTGFACGKIYFSIWRKILTGYPY